MPTLRAAAALLCLGLVAAGGTSSCSTPDSGAVTEIAQPDYNLFKTPPGVSMNGSPTGGVSLVLERRCGTLDCHGQVSRPLRIYGQYGLRFVDDGGNYPGGAGTTETEHQANFQAVIGLQPEIMSLVVGGQDPPEALMLLRKPLLLERHKGGPVFESGDDAYNCIVGWLGQPSGAQFDPGACGRAAVQ
jgi:hypothetical protein